MKFNGIQAPIGEGQILEVHADLISPSQTFLSFLESQGFENDPFSVFHPKEYTHHLTGRTRCPKTEIRQVTQAVEEAVNYIIDQGRSETGLYMEVELVRQTFHFPDQLGGGQLRGLENFLFEPTGRYGGAKADVHVEFPSGKASETVREYLGRKCFYWVQTPKTKYFGSEEIATLQTDVYQSGKEVYDALCAKPLPNCTGIHLEQKLTMVASRSSLPMPEVIGVRRVL